ncbi:thioredoxin-like protein [Chytriomyces sp. MP71]|nr:thioredoxin-like protein [Chytriomyces sp. MP71]
MATLNMDDERMIAMLKGMGAQGDSNNDDQRKDEMDSDASESEGCNDVCDRGPHSHDPGFNDAGSVGNAILDTNTRAELGVGGAMTGVKGVVNDHRFHQQQERARRDLRALQDREKLDSKALRSGWIQRQIEAEEKAKEDFNDEDEEVDDLIKSLEDEEDPFIKAYKGRRLMEMANLSYRQSYGSLKEIGVDQYVQCVDSASRDVTVLVHLYQPRMESCRLVNAYLEILAAHFHAVKMVKIISTLADASFDDIALPAILMYRNGELVKSLLRMTDEIGGWAKTGRCSLEDFEEYLVRNKALSREF